MDDLDIAFNRELQLLLDSGRVNLPGVLVQHLRDIRKRAGVDAEAEIAAYRPKLVELSEKLILEFTDAGVVVKAQGSAEQTLKELRYGSRWFEGSDNITKIILAGLDSGR